MNFVPNLCSASVKEKPDVRVLQAERRICGVCKIARIDEIPSNEACSARMARGYKRDIYQLTEIDVIQTLEIMGVVTTRKPSSVCVVRRVPT